jgi:NADPH:quinone reductase-like Zn-dependent oxidoreductase
MLDPTGGDTQERSWQVLKKGGALLSLVQPPSAEKAKELGVRAAFVASHPNGVQLTEIAHLIDSRKLKPMSSECCRSWKCAVRTSSVKAATRVGKLSFE